MRKKCYIYYFVFSLLFATGTFLMFGVVYGAALQNYLLGKAGDANFEVGEAVWNGNVFQIQTRYGGTGVARAVQIRTGSNDGIYIDTSGNVAIGTTTPQGRFRVGGGDVVFDAGRTLRLYGNFVDTGSPGLRTIFSSSDHYSYGTAIRFGGGALTVIGGGEAADLVTTGGTVEDVVIAADNGVSIETGIQAGYASRYSWAFTPTGATTFPGGGAFTQPVIVGTPTASNHAVTKSYVDSATVSQTGWTDGGSVIYNTTLTDKVGIGVASPSYRLEIGALSGSIEPTAIKVDGGATDGRQIRIGDSYSATVGTRYSGAETYLASNSYQTLLGTDSWGKVASTYGSTIALLGINSNPSSWAFQIKYSPASTANGVLSSFFTDTLFTVLGDGKVGIGTTNPSNMLTIQQAASTGGETVAAVKWQSPSYILGYLGADASTYNSGALYIYKDGAANTRISGNGTSYLMGGNVGVGSTSPAYKLDVAGSGQFTQPVIVGTPTASTHAATKSYVDSMFSGSGQWTTSGNNIYSSLSGNVGIGTTSPGAKLDVLGDVKLGPGGEDRAAGATISLNSAVTYVANSDIGDSNRILSIVNPNSTTNAYAALGFRVNPNGGTANAMMDMRFVQTGATNTSKLIYAFNHAGGWADRFTIQSDGNVGIGTTTPGTKLDVAGNARFSGLLTSTVSTGADILTWDSNGTAPHFRKMTDQGGLALGTDSSILLHAGDNLLNLLTDLGLTSASNGEVLYLTADNGIELIANRQTDLATSYRFSFTNSGRFGVLNTNPSYTLDVTGTGRFTQPVIVGTPTATNHAATKSYVDSMFTGSGQWTTSGSNIYSSLSGNVGIGTSSPGGKLDVVGEIRALTGWFYAPEYTGYSTGFKSAGSYSLTFQGNQDCSANAFLFQNAYSIKGDCSGTSQAFKWATTHASFGSRGIGFSYGGGAGNGIAFYADAVASTAGSTFTPTQRMIINNSGNVGIGSTSPGYKLDVAGTGSFTQPVIVGTPVASNQAATKSYVDSIVSGGYLPLTGGTLTGNLNMNGNNIIGVNKLTVATIDPLYEIGGTKYATYASSIAGGVREEYVGRGKLSPKFSNSKSETLNTKQSQNTKSESQNNLGFSASNLDIGATEYQYIIDFNDVKRGSDLWVWRQTVDFSKDNVEVMATPYGTPVPISYEIEGNKIIFRSEILNTKYSIPNTGLEFSYRLVGKRVDWRNWPTYAKDQNEKANIIIP